MKIAVLTVPYITTPKLYEFAKDTLESLKTDHEIYKIAVINACLPDYLPWVEKNHDEVIWNDRNVLSRAWNRGIKRAKELGYDLVFIPNLDVTFHTKTLDNLVKWAYKNKDYTVIASVVYESYELFAEASLCSKLEPGFGRSSFSSFLLRISEHKKVGDFDEVFEPAYYEDDDYSRRLVLSKAKFGTALDSIFYHRVSQTLLNDTELNGNWNPIFEKNAKRYSEKWGGPPGSEKFTKPYDLQTTPLPGKIS